MSDILYDLVFKGDLVKNTDLATAKKNVQALFKIDSERVDVLFSGKAVTLKKGLSFEAASKYRVAIKKAGAVIELVEQVSSAKTTSRGKAVFGVADADESPAREAPSSAPVSQAPLVSATSVAAAAAGTTVVEGAVKSSSSSSGKQAETHSDKGSDSNTSFELAPAGADVLASTERTIEPPISLDLSEYALASPEGNLVKESEILSDEPVNIPHTGSISLADAGEEILSSDQKHQEPEINIDLSAVSLAEPGATIVEPSAEEAVSVDISHLSIAD